MNSSFTGNFSMKQGGINCEYGWTFMQTTGGHCNTYGNTKGVPFLGIIDLSGIMSMKMTAFSHFCDTMVLLVPVMTSS